MPLQLDRNSPARDRPGPGRGCVRSIFNVQVGARVAPFTAIDRRLRTRRSGTQVGI